MRAILAILDFFGAGAMLAVTLLTTEQWGLVVRSVAEASPTENQGLRRIALISASLKFIWTSPSPIMP